MELLSTFCLLLTKVSKALEGSTAAGLHKRCGDHYLTYLAKVWLNFHRILSYFCLRLVYFVPVFQHFSPFCKKCKTGVKSDQSCDLLSLLTKVAKALELLRLAAPTSTLVYFWSTFVALTLWLKAVNKSVKRDKSVQLLTKAAGLDKRCSCHNSPPSGVGHPSLTQPNRRDKR